MNKGKRTVSVLDFGVKENSAKIQTEKFQEAINYCFLNGGGEVCIPEGVYHIGSIRLRSGVTLHLMENAVLKGSRNPEDYLSYLNDTIEPIPEEMKTDVLWNPPDRGSDVQKRDYSFMRPASRWNNGIIKAICADNISVIGEKGSRIDGCDCYDKTGEEGYRGPHGINMYYCNNIHMSGYVIENCGNWAHLMFYCKNIDIKNVEVYGGHDGAHFRGSKNICVENCIFYTGDDCIAGFNNINMIVKDCEMNTACSAFRLGGTNVLIEKCHMFGPAKYVFRGSLNDKEKETGILDNENSNKRYNMLSAYTYFSDFAQKIELQPANIIMNNCKIENADRFIHYNFSGNEYWQSNKPLKNITISNTDANNIIMPLTMYGSCEEPLCAEIINSNISFSKSYREPYMIMAANYSNITLKNVNIGGFNGQYVVKSWSKTGEIGLKNINMPDLTDVVYTDEDFICTAI